ncbi:hypothetical protein SAMN03159353_1012154 [Cedecea sp. NFIX57]|nr:hypothetical protein SAMN03159353_1012154 [Cedecea sp. NFIX57]
MMYAIGFPRESPYGRHWSSRGISHHFANSWFELVKNPVLWI